MLTNPNILKAKDAPTKMKNHLVNHLQHCLENDSTLHVVGVISNPARWNSRIRIAREWIEAMQATPNVKLYLVELAHGDRKFEVTDKHNPQHLQLRTHGSNECWHKENLINIGMRRLVPHAAKYLAWIDTDVFWTEGSDWALKAIHELQTYDLIQPWKDCTDLGANGDIMLDELLRPMVHTSFCYVHSLDVPKQTGPNQPYKYAHSGFAWACTRKFWENTHGLMEKCVIGSADHLMAWAAIGKVDHAIHGLLPDGFKRMAHAWQQAAVRVTKGNVGYVRTRIEHKFHGSKRKRGYRSRNELFVDHKFNPETDLGYDENGLLYIAGKPALEEGIRRYNRSRDEDGISET
jgi:hypothetical protein